MRSGGKEVGTISPPPLPPIKFVKDRCINGNASLVWMVSGGGEVAVLMKLSELAYSNAV